MLLSADVKLLPSFRFEAISVRKSLHLARSAIRRATAPSLLGALRADLLVCPFTAPTYSEPCVPTVTIIYDLQYKVYPQFFSPEAVAYRSRSFRESIRRSSALVAISDYTRQMAIREGGVDPDVITTIHLRAAIRSDPDRIDRAVLAKLNLHPKRYLLYPANFWRHKNHELLFLAFGMARQQGLPSDVQLVCTGAAGEPERETFVACSNVTSLPEIAGEAAVLFDPQAPADVAGAMMKLVNDQDAVRDLVNLGHARAVPFAGLDGLAERYWNVFERAARAKARHNMLTGVASDGWIGAEAKLRTVAAEQDRHLRIDLTLPPFVPYRKVSVRVRQGRRTLARISMARGSSHSRSIALPRAEALIEISSWPSFVPAVLAMGDDKRELSIILDRCAIIAASGDPDELFP